MLVKPNATYMYSNPSQTGTNKAFRLFFYNASKTYLRTRTFTTDSNQNGTFTTNSDEYYARIQGSTSNVGLTDDVQVEIGYVRTAHNNKKRSPRTIVTAIPLKGTYGGGRTDGRIWNPPLQKTDGFLINVRFR